MDADDVLDEENRTRLRALLAGLDGANVAYVMQCLCLPDPLTGAATAVDHLRLFRHHPTLRWAFRVHEQILPSFRRHGGEVRWSDVVIHHTGYRDPAVRQRKLRRDLRLLQLDYAQDPENPFTLFNLGSVYQEMGRTAEALELFRRSLQRSQPADSIVRKLYALVVQCHNHLGQRQEALAACQQGRSHYPEDVELLFQEGVVRRGLSDLAGAEVCWRQALAVPPGQHFASVHTGLRGYLSRCNLGGLYREQGRDAEAEAQWRAALAEQPGCEPAWRGLGELYLAQGRWNDAEALARELERGPRGALYAAAVRGRALLAQKEFGRARALLAEAAGQFPQEIEPRLLLSYVLLQEGRDWEAAEGALRAVLALDPSHAEARHNLEVVLRQQGKANGQPGR
jgi:tetratricopeptide (TPR) repeat protein